MTYYNRYEVEYFTGDRRIAVQHQMKQVRGASQAQTKERELRLSAVLTRGALLSLVAGL